MLSILSFNGGGQNCKNKNVKNFAFCRNFKIFPLIFFQKQTKKAFTLAEVLITLAIIGIIAALTIPTLMENYKRNLYEASFKRTYNLLSLGMAQMIQQNGDNIISPDISGTDSEGHYPEEQFMMDFAKYIGGARGKSYCSFADPKKSIINGYDGKELFSGCPQCYLPLKNNTDMILRNQCYVEPTMISGVQLGVIMIDTNTIAKGPNRWGYDVWAFRIDTENKILVPDGATGAYYGHHRPYKCGSQGASKSNHDYGCSYYAIINKCPDDDTKTYWECLKP